MDRPPVSAFMPGWVPCRFGGASRLSRAEAARLLGISTTASPAEVVKAFRVLALKHHPDRGGDPALFRRLTDARELLESGKGSKGKSRSRSRGFSAVEIEAKLRPTPVVEDQGWYATGEFGGRMQSLEAVCGQFAYRGGPLNQGKKPQLVDICVALENRARLVRERGRRLSAELSVFYAPSAIHRVSAAIHDHLTENGAKLPRRQVQDLLQALEILKSLTHEQQFYDQVWARAVEVSSQGPLKLRPPFSQFPPGMRARLFSALAATVLYDTLSDLADASFFPQIVLRNKQPTLREPDFGSTKL